MFAIVVPQDATSEEGDNLYANIDAIPDVEKIKDKYRTNEPGSRAPAPLTNKNRRQSKNVIESLAAKAEMLANGK